MCRTFQTPIGIFLFCSTVCSFSLSLAPPPDESIYRNKDGNMKGTEKSLYLLKVNQKQTRKFCRREFF